MRKLVLILIMTLVVGFSSFADKYQYGQAIVTIDRLENRSYSEYSLIIDKIADDARFSQFKPSKQQYELVHEIIYSNYNVKDGDVFYAEIRCLPKNYHVLFVQGGDSNKWVFLYAN